MFSRFGRAPDLQVNFAQAGPDEGRGFEQRVAYPKTARKEESVVKAKSPTGIHKLRNKKSS